MPLVPLTAVARGGLQKWSATNKGPQKGTPKKGTPKKGAHKQKPPAPKKLKKPIKRKEAPESLPIK